ncbi:mannosyltransferase family protein [Propionibacteriaceae bacterium Y1923]
MGTSSESALVVALVWGVSRALLVIVLLATVLQGRGLADALRGWDAAIYTRLAEQGYTPGTDYAFFPGLPLLLNGLSRLGIDAALAGALVSLVCSALAAWALYRLGSQGFGGRRRHQPVAGAIAASLWLLAPVTVFTSVAYTEAPFCAAAWWSWERARAGRWGQAALLAGLACTLRVSGLFLVLALLVLAIVGNDPQDGLPRTMRERLLNACWLLVPVGVLFAYQYWLFTQTGSWTTWFDAQEQGWNREFTWPHQALRHTMDAADPAAWPDRPAVGWVFAAEIASMATGVVVTIVCLLKQRWAEAVWVGVQVAALGTSYWYMSVNRAVLLWFPLFIMVGALLGAPFQKRTGPWRIPAAVAIGVVMTLSTVLLVVWARLWFTGQWAS